MILWEEKSLEPEGFLTVTYTLRGRTGGHSRVKSTFTVNSLLKELPYLEKPVLNPLPWKRDNYERWARVKPTPEWNVWSRPAHPQHNGHLGGQAISAAVDKAWSVIQVIKPTKGTGVTRANTEIVVKSADVDCPSIDSIIDLYADLQCGRTTASPRQ
ncbi:hypothetical protein ElyMa_005422300 [Elysia marginata]|uniref:Uncharacterized protein n=1 Tax=Elysia marginata TaxID=1093978 RepID=A0AAV4EJS5_9GAST|nr:hypothetical protein ElyMa_005422300 [Elysia marginata]